MSFAHVLLFSRLSQALSKISEDNTVNFNEQLTQLQAEKTKLWAVFNETSASE